MREVLIIVRREFIERVRSRAFILGTLIFPVFMVGIFALPLLSSRSTVHRTLALVDQSPAPVGQRFTELLTAADDSTVANTFTLEPVEGSWPDVRDALAARVNAGEIDGWIVLPADILEDNELIYRAQNVANESVVRDIRNAGSEALQGERLQRAGLRRTDVAALTRRITIDDAAITGTGGEGRGATSTFIFAYILAFAIYFITVFYGVNVLRSVLEEKTSRIAEVMVSTVKASHLMAGKIIGVGSAALFQVGIWAAFIVLVATRSELLTRRFGLPPDAFAALTIPVGDGILFLLYFIFGFLTFAAVFAAVGAAMTSEQEAQSMQLPILLPLFLPLIFSTRIAGEPLSGLSTALGLFPLSAPIAMPMRIAAGQIPGIQIAASLVLLVLGLLAVMWLGGKIYRIGILSTGKRPSLAELARWLREA